MFMKPKKGKWIDQQLISLHETVHGCRFPMTIMKAKNNAIQWMYWNKKKISSAGIHINDTFFISKQVYYLMSNVYFL